MSLAPSTANRELKLSVVYGVISFVSVFGVIILIGLIFYWLPEPRKLETVKPILDTDVLRYGRTFDLIAVAYTSVTCSLVKMFTRSRWSHVCMLYRAPTTQRLYIIEAMRTRKYPHEIQIINFDHWLAGNEGFDKLYLPFTLPRSNDIVHAEYAVANYTMHYFRRGLKTNMNVFDWISTLKDTPYPNDPEEQRWIHDDYTAFCTEFIILLLQHVGIVQKKWDPACYSPVRMMYDLHKDLVHKNAYNLEPFHMVKLQTHEKYVS